MLYPSMSELLKKVDNRADGELSGRAALAVPHAVSEAVHENTLLFKKLCPL